MMILFTRGIYILLSIRNTNKHFWRHCQGRHRVKYIDKVVNKIEIGIRLLNRLTWLCFFCLC